MRESNLEAAWPHCTISCVGRENVGTEEGQHEESLTATATVLVFQESTVKRALAAFPAALKAMLGCDLVVADLGKTWAQQWRILLMLLQSG